MKRLIIPFLLLLIIGCKNPTDLNKDGIPNELAIALYAGGDNPGAIKAGMEPFKIYLEKKLGVKVKYQFTTDYNATIEAIRAKKVHIAYLSPFSYVLASQKHDITPLVTIGENGKPTMYHSVIFTNNFTGINSIADLKAKAKQLTICFSDPASTSGHLIPRAYLSTLGINVENSFKENIFAGSHAASVLSVTSRKVDIGCSTIEYGIEKLERGNLVKKEDLKILWTSDPIVSSPIVIRNDVNKAFAEKIKNIYLNLSHDAPEVFAAYLKLYHPNYKKLSYIPVQDSLYNGLRKIARGIKNLNMMGN